MSQSAQRADAIVTRGLRASFIPSNQSTFFAIYVEHLIVRGGRGLKFPGKVLRRRFFGSLEDLSSPRFFSRGVPMDRKLVSVLPAEIVNIKRVHDDWPAGDNALVGL